MSSVLPALGSHLHEALARSVCAGCVRVSSYKFFRIFDCIDRVAVIGSAVCCAIPERSLRQGLDRKGRRLGCLAAARVAGGAIGAANAGASGESSTELPGRLAPGENSKGAGLL